ncbi:MAG: Coenzyme F420 hydrogenase/dehydrogenase, beta subunit C-terminal domain [Oscillospiraceae bacterium]|nr:Coenzyme F420 hydrogenase/dehydrogenase, beta subunit C-terminal domain [Oscillospiraceae bacterium]
MQNHLHDMDEENCCGCGACLQICPQSCISSAENKRGFAIPVIDAEKCVNCGLCKKVCPWQSILRKNQVIESYIAKAAQESVQKKCTSGGIFNLLAEEILKNGGVVYGCEWTDELLVHHVRVDRVENLPGLLQSKYVQSDTERTFIEVKKDLNANRFVLYSGTACQLAGLKNFVGEHENLILVEVACHGVPSPGLFREYIHWIEEKTQKNVVGFQFRNRKKHKKGEHYQLRINYSDGTEEFRYAAFDPYYASFISGQTLRGVCYDCIYKGKDRVGDILLADFWGAEKEHPEFHAENGASAVVILSSKGKEVFEKINVTCKPSSWEKVTAHNRSLIEGAEKTDFYQTIDINRFIPKVTAKTLLKVYMPEKIKYLLKRL